VILLTLGTHEQPFDRALDLVAPLGARERVLVQHGHTAPRPGTPGVEWVEFTERERMRELVAEASTVVCHAGTGCIVTAISLGRTPVVIPRLARHGEHVDDHQLQITTEMQAAGMVVACLEGDDLEAAIAEARGRRAALPGRGDLKLAVAEATAPARPRRIPSLRAVVGAARAR
jgi:UDP-N-acetylglucosamine transferase subunit ALG13